MIQEINHFNQCVINSNHNFQVSGDDDDDEEEVGMGGKVKVSDGNRFYFLDSQIEFYI